MKVGQQIECGHLVGRVSSVKGDEALVDWPEPQQCMCANKPGARLQKSDDGTWWAQAVRFKWEAGKVVNVEQLDHGVRCKLLPEV